MFGSKCTVIHFCPMCLCSFFLFKHLLLFHFFLSLMLHSFYLSLTLDLPTYLPLLFPFILSYISTFHLEIVLLSEKVFSTSFYNHYLLCLKISLILPLFYKTIFFFLLNAREIFHCCLASNILTEKAALSGTLL